MRGARLGVEETNYETGGAGEKRAGAYLEGGIGRTWRGLDLRRVKQDPVEA